MNTFWNIFITRARQKVKDLCLISRSVCFPRRGFSSGNLRPFRAAQITAGNKTGGHFGRIHRWQANSHKSVKWWRRHVPTTYRVQRDHFSSCVMVHWKSMLMIWPFLFLSHPVRFIRVCYCKTESETKMFSIFFSFKQSWCQFSEQVFFQRWVTGVVKALLKCFLIRLLNGSLVLHFLVLISQHKLKAPFYLSHELPIWYTF